MFKLNIYSLKIILLTYINRSGSTFLANCLNKYEGILVCPEAETLLYNYLFKTTKKFYSSDRDLYKISYLISNDSKLKHWKLDIDINQSFKDIESYQDVFVEIINSYRKVTKPKSNILLFKGDNIINFIDKFDDKFINKYDLHFIAIIRDCRAIYYSQKTTIGTIGLQLADNPIYTAKKWSCFLKKTEKYRNRKYFSIIKYEDLIQDPFVTISNLIKKLGIMQTVGKPVKSDLFTRLPEEQREMHKNIIFDANPSKIFNFISNLSQIEIALIEKIARTQLIKNNYKLINPHINLLWFNLIRNWLYLKYLYKILKEKILPSYH